MQSTQNIKSYNNGFTILEISIVLVIVGLLVAGVLGGQEIIKSMKINGTIAQMNEITAAANSFKLKYDSLPGDMPDATDYWGINSDCPNQMFELPEKTTCNGNGDGTLGNTENPSERSFFWHHLSNSDMFNNILLNIESFFYAAKSSYNEKVFISATTGMHEYVRPELRQDVITYFLATQEGVEEYINLGWSAFTPEDAKTLDSKIDDSMPTTGNVSTENLYGPSSACINSTNPIDYDINNDSNKCALIVKSNF
jgi:prepilin-type N-terminal cleavage/methylation domain-containing protein